MPGYVHIPSCILPSESGGCNVSSKLLPCSVCLPNTYTIQLLICYLGSDLYHSLVLKTFSLLFGSVLYMHNSGVSEIGACS